MKKPIIIAECCQNHNGDINVLKQMVYEAAESGADYVKIQAIRSSELVFRDRFENGLNDKTNQKCIVRPFAPEKDRLFKLDLTLDEEKYFVDLCKSVGIKSMVTLFTWNGLYDSIDLGYDAIKVASYDCASFPFLKEIKKNWNRIFVSTGATFEKEIKKAATVLKGSDFQFLHCVTIYPTKLNQLHLLRMKKLKQYNEHIGFSDHTKPSDTQLIASKLAMSLGASCIERHFTILDENMTKDGPVSINPAQLKELCEFGQYDVSEQKKLIEKEYPLWRSSSGNPERELTDEELLNRDYYRGRFASKINGEIVNNWEEAY
jgi:N,N'-diacetyllegionaminate synthase